MLNSHPTVHAGAGTELHSSYIPSILFGIRTAKVLELGVMNSRNKNEIPLSPKEDTEGNC